jgi:hypothetical protein
LTYVSDVLNCLLMMEAISTSETPVNFFRATWHNIPEDSQLQEMV